MDLRLYRSVQSTRNYQVVQCTLLVSEAPTLFELQRLLVHLLGRPILSLPLEHGRKGAYAS
jgi:hypothetical protein